MAIVISNIIQWVVVPLIMVALFILALVIAGRVSSNKASAWSGFWAGLVVFVVYIVSQLNTLRDPVFSSAQLPGFQFIPLLIGAVAGYLFLWLARLLADTSLVGFTTLLLAASSTSALFTYIFIDSLRVFVLYLTLGIALGILIHIILDSGALDEVFD